MRPEQFAQWVPADQLTTADWELLLRADAAGPAFNSLPAEVIARCLAAGEMHLFRLKPQRGLLLVEVRTGPSGLRRLGIVRAAGTGLGFMSKAISALLQHTAREWGCQQIETMVYSKRLALAMTRAGARAEAVNMVLEVKADGH